jgi:hypothetical protein
MSTPPLRDNAWLQARLQTLWDTYYSDGRRGYPIAVHFGPRARYRYGSIYSIGAQCHILINRLFAHPDVPEYVIDATLVHELAHYVHGFGSGLPKLYSHPHRGGVVDAEMERRGCTHLEELAGKWRREHWPAFYTAQSGDAVKKRCDRERRNLTRWEMYLATPDFRTAESLRERLEALSKRFGFETPPFTAEWLTASVRHSGLSYRYERESRVCLHGTLADSAAPDCVVDYELSYWLAVEKVGSHWSQVEAALKEAGVWSNAQRAIQWRRKVWANYYLAAHPLKAK